MGTQGSNEHLLSARERVVEGMTSLMPWPRWQYRAGSKQLYSPSIVPNAAQSSLPRKPVLVPLWWVGGGLLQATACHTCVVCTGSRTSEIFHEFAPYIAGVKPVGMARVARWIYRVQGSWAITILRRCALLCSIQLHSIETLIAGASQSSIPWHRVRLCRGEDVDIGSLDGSGTDEAGGARRSKPAWGSARTRACVCVCVCVCLCVIYTHMHTCMHACMYVCVCGYVRMYASIYLSIYLSTYLFI